ncbi:SWIB/MDM2 domain-containing protein [Pilobolus umbonatus]|nr:SWIB/MDM2 domain-containing protein [Pilobolus umbonatus]
MTPTDHKPRKRKSNLDDTLKKKSRKRKKKVIAAIDPNAPPKPKRITGLNKPLLLSPELSSIMNGERELSRPEIVKHLWYYIKSNQLQDPADRRFILCDNNLKLIFHKDRVNSFGMNRDLSAHLTKKEVAPIEQPIALEDYVDAADIMTTEDTSLKWNTY